MNKCIMKIDVLLCLFLSLAFIASPYYIKNGSCQFDSVYFGSVLFLFLFLLGCSAIIRRAIFLYYSMSLKTKLNNNRSKLVHICNYLFYSKWALLKITLVIFICWLPILIALYPGTLINDTWGQLQQFIEFTNDGTMHRNVLSDHHPFFDTFLIGSFIIPLTKITGTWHIAIFSYVIIQAIITSFVFAYSILYVYHKLKIGNEFSISILIVYCIFPIYAASVQTVSKDALFSWGYVLFFLCFMEIIRTKGFILREKRFFIKFILIVLFCILTKKVGIYVIAISMLALLVAKIINKKRIVICLLITLCAIGVILPGIRHALGISSGGLQEMFSIPFQQTARYVKYYPNDITPKERTAIDKVLNFNNLPYRYEPISADPVKGYSQKGTKKDYFIYLETWISQGIRHPNVYINAYNAMVSGWFSFYEYKPLMDMAWHNQLNPDMIPAWVPERNNFSEMTATIYQNLFDNLFNIPFFTIFLCYGFYASIVPAFMLGTVIRKHKKKDIQYWLPAIPMIVSIVLGCWLAPVSIHFEGRRYLYPLVYTFPLIISWCLFVYKNESEKLEREYYE